MVALGYGLGTMAWPYAKLVYALGHRFVYGGGPSTMIVALGSGLQDCRLGYAKLDFSEGAGLRHHAGSWRATAPFHPCWRPAVEPGRWPSARRYGDGLLALGTGGVAAAAMAGKYTAVLFAGAVVGQWALSSRWWTRRDRGPALRYLIALVLPVGALGALAVGLALAFTGKTPIVLTSGTGRLWEDWLALPLWTGLRGLLLSPGKSLPLYSPWLLLALPGDGAFSAPARSPG